jgi:hypothetical protein
VSERYRELVFIGVIVVGLALGGLFDLATGDVSPPPAPAVAHGDFIARALFCPPTGGHGQRQIAVASESGGAVPVGFGAEHKENLTAGRALLYRSKQTHSTPVTGYNGSIAAAAAVSSTGPVGGASAAQCARSASPRWFFAGGSAGLDFDERILLYNPFPDEAVVRLSFFTPQGQETKASFEEVPVAAGTSEAVQINKAIRVRSAVSVAVEAKRGRVVAWKEVFARPDDKPRGVQGTLGANNTATAWYFPDGAIGPGADQRLSVLNPTSDEAVVSITLTTPEETLQPEKLLELAVPRRSTLALKLNDFVTKKDFSSISATVNSVNGVGVVAERTVWYSTDELSGVTSDTGLRKPLQRWMLGPATLSPSTDSIVLMNPGAGSISVSVSLLRPDGDTIEPEELADLEVGAGSRRRVPVGSFTDGRPMVALISADGPILAERFSYSAEDSDVAAVMGVPLRRLP